MPNIMGTLRYEPPLDREIKTEEDLLELFADLRKQYEEFNEKSITITYVVVYAFGDEPVLNFKRFLEVATGGQKILLGTTVGNIQCSLKYDLSMVRNSTRGWDEKRHQGCLSCTKQHLYETDEFCEEHRPGTNCSEYSAKRTNAEGKPARKLAELIEEAAK